MIKGIIFDMDNTLLQSNIDFKRMKSDIFDFLIQNNILTTEFAIHEHTTSTLIEYVRALGISDDLYESIMDITTKHELIGMKGAGLEPGAKLLLESICEKYVLVVMTNNSLTAATEALENTEIAGFFKLIIGREQMSALKPSPSGYHYVMNRFTTITPGEWLSIGDSWIDGKAAQDAGIPFISYRADVEQMLQRGVHPIAQMNHLLQLIDYLEGENCHQKEL
jgi:phosphoglycolate phosphatase